jgi:transposase
MIVFFFRKIGMPFKHNESRREKIKKSRYKVTNWAEYNQSLRERGNITLWFTQEAIEKWHPEKQGKRGRPFEYSEHAINTALLVREVFKLPLRQTEGFLNSIVSMMDVDIEIPDFSSISKRSGKLSRLALNKAMKPGSHVIVDSTGLKVYGQDEWHQVKHKVKARRTWRKLHLAIDERHQVIAVELTTPEVGDPTAVPDLLEQIDSDFDTFIADGAYDGDPIYQAVFDKQADAQVVIPPHKTAILSLAGDSQRDRHIRAMEAHGRMNWQRRTGYNQRNYAELAMRRFKGIFGNTLKARALPQQKTEAWIATQALNRMTQLGMPSSVKIS